MGVMGYIFSGQLDALRGCFIARGVGAGGIFCILRFCVFEVTGRGHCEWRLWIGVLRCKMISIERLGR